MSKRTKKVVTEATDPRAEEMAEIRKVPRGERTQEQIVRLRELNREVCRERFKREAPRRLEKAIHALDRVSMLGDPNMHDSRPSERDHIIGQLQAALDRVTSAFARDEDNGEATSAFPWEDDGPVNLADLT